jgi:TolB-like protein
VNVPPGTRIGPYEVLGLLGVGGMGEVYRARDTRLDRVVAIKVLPAQLASSPHGLARFHREARAVAALNHPNICTIHDVDSGEAGGRPYLAMELVEGETLHRRLQRGALPVHEIVDIAIAAADALDAAHAKGFIHRDIKPANIMLTARGPKILDFGLAKGASADVQAASYEATRLIDGPLTDPGATVGTVAYMSPEQLRGEEIDARSDLFSLGLVLYEMSTGQPAFSGATPAMVSSAILHADPPPPRTLRPDLPPAVETVILKALEKDRTLRCQSASEIRADLRRFARTELPAPISTPAPTPPAATAPAASSPPSDARLAAALVRRHRVAVAVAAVTFVAMVAGGAAVWMRGGTASGTTPAVSAAAGERVTLAVVPFRNIGPEDQEYFADGFTVSLSGELRRQVPGLWVKGDGSASVVGQMGEDTYAVGRALGVKYILGGTTQKDGDRVRITAALIDAGTGQVLWDNIYDRVYDDIFEIYNETVASVARELQIVLGVGVGAQRGMTRRIEAYDEYLRARARMARGAFVQASEHAANAIRLDDSFAIARWWLARILINRAAASPDRAEADQLRRRAAEQINRAAEDATDLPAVGHAKALLAWAGTNDLRTAGAWADEMLQNASRPPSVDLAELLMGVGRARDALVELEAARANDPLYWYLSFLFAAVNSQLGRFPESFEEIARGRQLGGGQAFFLSVGLDAARSSGDGPKVTQLLEEFRAFDPNGPAVVIGSLGPRPSESEIRRVAATPALQSNNGRRALAGWAAYYGYPHLALQYVDQAFDPRLDNGMLPWASVFSGVRQLPEFKEFLERRGYVAYWKAYGWGDFCHQTDTGFECR